MGKDDWFWLCAVLAMLSFIGVLLPISRIYDWKVSLFRKLGLNDFASWLEKRKSWAPAMIKNGLGFFGIICVLIPLILLCYYQLFFVFSGDMFHDTFNRYSEWNGVPAIRCGFLFFTLFTAVVLPYVAIVRCRIDRSYSLLYWLFLIITAAICVFLLSPLTCAIGKMIIYIRDMGSTDKRICGLIYGVFGYIIVLGFLYWAAIYKPGKKKSS